MELVEGVVRLRGDRGLDQERLRKLQGGLHNGALQEQKLTRSKLNSGAQRAWRVGGADLVQEAGERPGHVAFEGELAVLAGRPLGAGPLEQHAGHAVPVGGPDGVSLQRYVGGRLQGRFDSGEQPQTKADPIRAQKRTFALTKEKACAVARRQTAIFWRQAMIREQARASRWAIPSTRSSAIIKLLAMLTITSPSWSPCKQKKQLHMFRTNPAALPPSVLVFLLFFFFTHIFELLNEFADFFDHLSHKDDVHFVREIGSVDGVDQQAASLGHHVALVQRHLQTNSSESQLFSLPPQMFAVQKVGATPG